MYQTSGWNKDDWFGCSFKDIDDFISYYVLKLINAYKYNGIDVEDLKDDMYSAGWMGACKAKELYAKKPKSEHTAKFTSYAYYEINGQIKRVPKKYLETVNGIRIKDDSDPNDEGKMLGGIADNDLDDYESVLTTHDDIDEQRHMRSALTTIEDVHLVVAYEVYEQTIPQMKELTGDPKVMDRVKAAKERLAKELGKELLPDKEAPDAIPV